MNEQEIKEMADKKRQEFKETILDPSTKIARIVVEKMLENFDIFMEGYDEITKEEQEILDKKRLDFAINLLGDIAITSNIPSDYASFGIQKVSLALDVVKETIDSCVKSWNKEILSRVIQSKSTLDGKYNAEYATLKDHMNTLTKLRNETGGMDSYIITNKSKE